jgi:phytoene/squalene synthetase
MRRPGLLLEGLRADRDRPDLDALRELQPAERFVWGILPHAARSFAPCIVALPGRLALPAAVAYLYCRVLDTYEDLIDDPARRDAALVSLADRLDAVCAGGGSADVVRVSFASQDQRDAAHALLADESLRLDGLLRGMDAPVQRMIADLVRDMSAGMRWAGGVFDAQAGVLADGAQLRTYCDAVLGNPIRFAARLFDWGGGGEGALSGELEAAAMDVGEFLQLANITRDIEKDLARGVAYHPSLAADVGASGRAGLDGRVMSVRVALLDRALGLAPAYTRLVEGLSLGAGWKSVSAILMLRLTERYYRGCGARVGVAESLRSGVGRLVWSAWPALVSRTWTQRQLGASVERLCALREELPTQASSMYLS